MLRIPCNPSSCGCIRFCPSLEYIAIAGRRCRDVYSLIDFQRRIRIRTSSITTNFCICPVVQIPVDMCGSRLLKIFISSLQLYRIGCKLNLSMCFVRRSSTRLRILHFKGILIVIRINPNRYNNLCIRFMNCESFPRKYRYVCIGKF